jgi:hypothetical protein
VKINLRAAGCAPRLPSLNPFLLNRAVTKSFSYVCLVNPGETGRTAFAVICKIVIVDPIDAKTSYANVFIEDPS